MYGHVLRAQALKQQLADSYPHIQLQHIYEMTGDDIEDCQITRQALADFPDTNLFVCPGAYSRGNLQAIRKQGYFKKAKIICYDYSKEVGDEINNRNIVAAIIQRPQEQGYNAVKLLFEYLTSDTLPKTKNHYIKTRILLKENLIETDFDEMSYRKCLSRLENK